MENQSSPNTIDFQAHNNNFMILFACIKNKSSQHVAMHFENMWLACYPCPICCVHDQGAEFCAAVFQGTLAMLNIDHVPITAVKNPQAKEIPL
jgi:hypothetical protein